ncbi:MAG TPA: response regulator transcription factor [Edaphobacter sp.]|nr:response regulator transcription factor [Edaphobacter sp.]
MRILIVEDEPKMAELICKGLSREHYSVMTARNGPDGLALALAYPFDAMILDVMIPGFSGFELAIKLRAKGNATPILFLTARDTEDDLVAGLDGGGDDYLTKPFSFREFAARLRALTRRRPQIALTTLTIGDLTLNRSNHAVTRAGREINLTKTEYSLLEFFMRHPGQVLTRDVLIDAVWGLTDPIESNTLDTFIKLLRQKIDLGYETRLLHTVRGFGYRFADR